MTTNHSTLFESSLKSLKFLHRGKVRDLYAVDGDKLLVIQTDRLSAFDVITPPGALNAAVSSDAVFAGSALMIRIAMRARSELENFNHFEMSPL